MTMTTYQLALVTDRPVPIERAGVAVRPARAQHGRAQACDLDLPADAATRGVGGEAVP